MKIYKILNEMIFYVSYGRLGNQFFQYAFLNTISKNNEKVFVINMPEFINCVDFINKKIRIINPGKNSLFLIQTLIKPLVINLVVKLKIFGYIQQNRNEKSYLPSLRRQKGILPITIVESDFFQSEKFFKPKFIDVTIKNIFLDKARDFLSKIPSEFTKVFIHVRRGDYLFESALGKKGINLPKSYYLEAIKEINKEVQNPFYVFLSDDIEYIECCYEGIHNKLISNNDIATDLAIMTLCTYGIASNSSFSWWGAYLMETRKKVIFPKYWYGWKSKVETHNGIQPSWGFLVDVPEITGRP